LKALPHYLGLLLGRSNVDSRSVRIAVIEVVIKVAEIIDFDEYVLHVWVCAGQCYELTGLRIDIPGDVPRDSGLPDRRGLFPVIDSPSLSLSALWC